jgi:protein-disulfide isomerase
MNTALRLGLLAMLALPVALQAAGPSRKAPVHKPASRPAATHDWSRTVVATPEGGFRMGNPNAPLKLVEFGSITCPHCAEFNERGGSALRSSYIRSGRLSWEYRPFMIFPTDPGIFLLLSCVGPASFFPLTDQLYAQQDQWVGQLQKVSQDEQQRIAGLSAQEQSAALVRAAGVDKIFLQRGVPAARINACLADQARLLRLVEVSRTASNLGVKGTPTFMLNGKILESVYGWETLEPRLKQGG